MGKMHAHPMSPNRIIFGERLEPGVVIQPGDVYDSTSGTWGKTPCPGIVLQKGCTIHWIRPEAA